MKIFNLEDEMREALKEALNRELEAFEDAVEVVKPIVKDVRDKGDIAVKMYDKKFSKIANDYEIRVSRSEINEAYSRVDREFIEALRIAIDMVRKFHEEERPRPWIKEIARGVKVGVLPRPIEIAGLYIPGGRAPYPSTAVMTCVPAKVAGVSKVVACTPPGPDGKLNPYVLVALNESGVDEVYKAGGAQAIAAMAYGTESITKVDVVAGPGNIYVTAAKYLVSNVVGIDVLAGPSELLVIADESADPKLIALDLASQAEHDPLAQIALATTDLRIARDVVEELKLMAEENLIVKDVLEKHFIVVYGDPKKLVDFANAYAPEHLQLMVSKPEEYVNEIRASGVLLVGVNTPTALSDYCAGPSHVLPTGRCSRFRSGVSTLTFTKFMHYVEVDELNEKIFRAAIKLAEVEGFKLHAEALKRRLKS
ncbi:MAG: histidinol dehydrogenase [Candidatus Nezhaarchaeales archaeon]